MEKLTLILGTIFLVIGFLGLFFRIVPPYDGDLMLMGSILFAAGVISRAIMKGCGKSL